MPSKENQEILALTEIKALKEQFNKLEGPNTKIGEECMENGGTQFRRSPSEAGI